MHFKIHPAADQLVSNSWPKILLRSRDNIDSAKARMRLDPGDHECTADRVPFQALIFQYFSIQLQNYSWNSNLEKGLPYQSVKK
jgi:hypothetical protein